MTPRSSRTRRIARALADKDVRCPGCGYNLRGLERAVCPECGREVQGSDLPGNERTMAWSIHLVDLVGVGIVGGVNCVLIGLLALAVVWQNRSSWFTLPRFQLGRHPETISTLTLYTLALSLIAWGVAWEYGSWESWRWQIALAIWCAALTVFHAVGVASLWI